MILRTPAPSSPAFLHFQRHFSVDPCRKSLPVDTSWSILPSGAVVNPTEFPSPGSSEYHLPLSKRPRSAGLSRLTARENRRLYVQMEQVSLLARQQQAVSMNNISISSKAPSDQDFQRAMEKLQKVQSGNFAGRRVLLSDEKVESCVLETDEVQYYKVATLHRSTPLKVFVRRTQGKTVVFVSKSIPEPSPVLSDAAHYKDYFEVGDGGMRFKCEAVFLAVKALTPTTVHIQVKFGRKSITRSEAIIKPRGSAPDLQSWDEYRCQQLTKSPSLSKDHIKKNLLVLSPASPVAMQAAKTKKKIIEQRRKSVLARKQSLAEEKKKKTFVLLHKHELRLQELEHERAILALQQRRENCLKDWIRLAANAAFIESLKDAFEQRKCDLAIKARQESAAIKTQSHIRRLLRGSNGQQIAMWHARNALRLYSHHTAKMNKEQIRGKLCEAISEAYQNSVVTKAVRRMMKLVVTTQRRWRRFVEQRAVRWESLNALWQSTLDETLKQLSKSKLSKRIKKRRDPTPAYLHISPELKHSLLSQHMSAAVALYRQQLAAYVSQQAKLRTQGKGAFLKAIIEAGSPLPAFPVLNYLPSKDEMKKIIDQAAKDTLKSLPD